MFCYQVILFYFFVFKSHLNHLKWIHLHVILNRLRFLVLFGRGFELSVVTVSDKILTHKKHCWIYCCTQIFADSLRNLQNSIVFINPSLTSNPTSFLLFKKIHDIFALGQSSRIFSEKGLLCFCFVVFVNSEPSIIQVYNFFIMAAFSWESTSVKIQD